MFEINRIFQGNTLDIMRAWPDNSISFCMTSPPYWSKRNYGKDASTTWKDGWHGQLGLEPTLQLYLEHMREVFQEVYRVLSPDGSFYLNIGDTYAGSGQGGQTGFGDGSKMIDSVVGNLTERPATLDTDMVSKAMMDIPHRLCIQMEDFDGWIKRSTIIWHKPNHMPDPFLDRLTPSYEFIFHFVKSSSTTWWRYVDKKLGFNGWSRTKPEMPHREIKGYRRIGEEYFKRWKHDSLVIRELRGFKLVQGVWVKPIYKVNWHSFDYFYDLDAIRVKPKYPPQMEYRTERWAREGKDTSFQFSKELRYNGKFTDEDVDPEQYNSPRARNMRKMGVDYEVTGLISAQKRADMMGIPGGREMSNPDGKNPGDIIEGYDSKYFDVDFGQTLQSFQRSQSQYFERKDSYEQAKELYPDNEEAQKAFIAWVHDHQSHPDGKNPGDILEMSPEVRRKEKLGLPSSYGAEGHPMKNPDRWFNKNGKNPGDFWTVSTKPYKEAHFAVYPLDLCYLPMLSSCPYGKESVVFDPFTGSGTTLVMAKLLGHSFVGTEINPEYISLANARLARIDWEADVLKKRIDKLIATSGWQSKL